MIHRERRRGKGRETAIGNERKKSKIKWTMKRKKIIWVDTEKVKLITH